MGLTTHLYVRLALSMAGFLAGAILHMMLFRHVRGAGILLFFLMPLAGAYLLPLAFSHLGIRRDFPDCQRRMPGCAPYVRHRTDGAIDRPHSAAMDAAPDTYRDTLLYAMAIAGSERALAERMQVKVALLATWLSGIEPIPYAIFLKAVDVVVDSTPKEISRSRQVLTTLRFPASRSSHVR